MNSDKRKQILPKINLILSGIALILAIFALCFQFSTSINSYSPNNIFDLVKNSVVEIKADSETYGSAYGSAVCIDGNHLITNAHILIYKDQERTEPYEYVSFRSYNSNEYYPVSIINYDIDKDLCLLKFDGNFENLNPISVRSHPEIKAGEKIYAVGNALNHGIGITEGIVSIPYINIDINYNQMMVIQCDIVITSGSSGGALLDEKGQLIGLTTFRVKDQNGYIVYGVGFAIPTITIESFLTK